MSSKKSSALFEIMPLKNLRSFSEADRPSAAPASAGREHLVQALHTDRLTDRLLGIKELVDVGLEKPIALARSATVVLGVAETAEMGAGRLDDLVADIVLDGAVLAGGGEEGSIMVIGAS
ncbi:hypothetical protein ACRAWD_06370 [Caulobacter segnis]